MAIAAADAVARNRMGMDMDPGHGQMRLHKSRKALAAAAAVVVKVAPCKPIARNRTESRTVRLMAATSEMGRALKGRALRGKALRGKAWLFCTAKFVEMTSASAIPAPISH